MRTSRKSGIYPQHEGEIQQYKQSESNEPNPYEAVCTKIPPIITPRYVLHIIFQANHFTIGLILTSQIRIKITPF